MTSLITNTHDETIPNSMGESQDTLIHNTNATQNRINDLTVMSHQSPIDSESIEEDSSEIERNQKIEVKNNNKKRRQSRLDSYLNTIKDKGH